MSNLVVQIRPTSGIVAGKVRTSSVAKSGKLYNSHTLYNKHQLYYSAHEDGFYPTNSIIHIRP